MKKKNLINIIIDNIKNFIFALINCNFNKIFNYSTFYIPSSSMEPTLLLEIEYL